MNVREALLAFATPPPEPFRQVRWQHDDYVRWDEWNARRLEALKIADEPGEQPTRTGPPETWFCMCFVGRNRKLNAATVERCERCGMTAPNVEPRELALNLLAAAAWFLHGDCGGDFDGGFG